MDSSTVSYMNRLFKVNLDGFGEIEVENLRHHPHHLHQTFDLRMRMVAYWKIVLRRLVDSVALHLQFSVFNLVNKDLEMGDCDS